MCAGTRLGCLPRKPGADSLRSRRAENFGTLGAMTGCVRQRAPRLLRHASRPPQHRDQRSGWSGSARCWDCSERSRGDAGRATLPESPSQQVWGVLLRRSVRCSCTWSGGTRTHNAAPECGPVLGGRVCRRWRHVSSTRSRAPGSPDAPSESRHARGGDRGDAELRA